MPNFNSNEPSEFGWKGYGGSERSHIVNFSYKGLPFPQGIADILVPQATYLLDRIVPLISGGLHAGWNWGQEARDNVNSPGRKSFHFYGNALDLNAPANGNNTNAGGHGLYQLPREAAAICRALGWLHGGEWSDPMHLENHNSPAEVLAWNKTHGHSPAPAPAPTGQGTPFPLAGNQYFGLFSGPAESISGLGKNDAQWRPYIAKIQRRVHAAADGEYGNATLAAVKVFQQQHGNLSVDGLTGPATWRALGI